MMIFFHIEGKVTQITNGEGVTCYPELVGYPMGYAWRKALKEGYIGWLGWCDVQYQTFVKTDTWENLLNHPLELISYEPDKAKRFATDLGYAFFDSPYLVDYPLDRKYPTWQVSASAGCIHSKVASQIGEILNKETNVNFWLNAVSFKGHKQGLITYSEPSLFSGSVGNLRVDKKYNPLSIYKKLYFLRCFGTFRQFLFYFGSIILSEGRLPLISFIRALLKPQYKVLDKLHLDLIPRTADHGMDTIDVLIPTLGRATYLKGVMDDFSVQTFLPKRIIIIEQLMEGELDSNLSFLSSTKWPFEIRHIITRQLGACHARNLGLKEVKSRWLFLADDDIRLNPNTIASALDQLYTFHIEAATIAVYQKGEVCLKRQPIMWDSFGSGCSIVKSSLLEDLTFDLALEFGYGEDKDYGIQIRKKGTAVIYTSDYPIFHLKAPIGGFRQKIHKPWAFDKFMPKPSPTVLFYIQKNHSFYQQKGYKCFYLIKQLSTIKGLISWRKILNSWNASERWVNQLRND